MFWHNSQTASTLFSICFPHRPTEHSQTYFHVAICLWFLTIHLFHIHALVSVNKSYICFRSIAHLRLLISGIYHIITINQRNIFNLMDLMLEAIRFSFWFYSIFNNKFFVLFLRFQIISLRWEKLHQLELRTMAMHQHHATMIIHHQCDLLQWNNKIKIKNEKYKQKWSEHRAAFITYF